VKHRLVAAFFLRRKNANIVILFTDEWPKTQEIAGSAWWATSALRQGALICLSLIGFLGLVGDTLNQEQDHSPFLLGGTLFRSTSPSISPHHLFLFNLPLQMPP
jgi:hypothetical protein